MFLYALKKAFFDLWDHLFFALAVNLVFTLAVLGMASLLVLFQGFGVAGLLLYMPLPFLLATLLGGTMTFWARDIVVQGSARFGDFLAHFRSSWKTSLAFGLAWLTIAAGFLFGVPFYTGLNEIGGFVFGVLMAWLLFFAAGMSLYYPGLNAQIEANLTKLAKKSFLVFLANPWASLVLALGFVVSVVASVFTLGFFPGILGISIWLQVGFRFLMAKYEWIEANPEADRKKVPWALILRDDMDKVGPRSFKSLIFPWKD
jgi:uncharacterized membrane protein YesL